MKRSSVTLVILSMLILSFATTLAQPWLQSLSPQERLRLSSIQRAFNEYWVGKDHTEKGKGWKQFKRWEWFWEQRVGKEDVLPDPMFLYREYEKVRSTRGVTGNPAAGNWTSLGPTQSVGGYSGLGRLNCVRVDPNNSNVIWVGSASGGLWKSTNGGGTWSSNTDELPTLGVTDIVLDPSNTNIMYIATGDGDHGDTYSVGVLKSTDGGMTWTTTGLNWTTSQVRTVNRLIMHPSNSSILISAGSNGIFKTTNAGTNWTQVSTTSSLKDMEFMPGTPTTLYAGSGGGLIFKSTNTGDSWFQLTSGLPTSAGRVALGVTPANGNYVYALFADPNNAGFFGMYRSTNSGSTWTLMANSPNILGWNETGSDVGGQGWYDLAVAVSQSNANEVYVGGVNNWKSTNGGATWSIISMWHGGAGPPEVHADQHDLYFVPGTSTLYSGNDGGIYRTTNAGSSWTWLGSGLQVTQFYRLGTSATVPGTVIGGSQDNGTKLLHSGVWDDVLGGDGMECLIDYTNANVMYATVYYGALYKSTNGGSVFSNISNNINESGAWITPFAMHPTDPQTIFGAFVNVWKTANGGSSWSKISNFSGSTLTVLAVAPSNPSVLYAGKGFQLYRTTDGGTSGWSTITLPSGMSWMTSLAVHPTDPNTIWITSSGYSAGAKVYQSTNAGSSWTNISGSLPNVPVNTIVYQNGSNDRVFVGTDIGVFYRDQTSGDWQDFNTSLPNVVIDELEIQYSSSKIRAATFGRGIWESDISTDPPPDIAVSPSSLNFTVAPGGSSSTTLTISNTALSGSQDLVWSITESSTMLATPLGQRVQTRPLSPERTNEAPVSRHDYVPDLVASHSVAGMARHDWTASAVTSWQADAARWSNPSTVGKGEKVNLLATIFTDDVESGTNGWTTQLLGGTTDDLWHISTLNAYSPTHSWWCGIEAQGNYATSHIIHTAAVSPSISLSLVSGTITLQFRENYSTEAGWDYCMVDVTTDGGVTWIPLRGTAGSGGTGTAPSGSSGGWVLSTLDLSGYAGQVIRVRFHFDTIDATNNSYPGWFFDDIVVTTPNEVAWLSESPTSGVIAPGSDQTINISVNASGLSPGTYSASLLLNSNDPDENPVVVPVTLTVTGGAVSEFGVVANNSDRTIGVFDAGSSTMYGPFLSGSFGTGELLDVVITPDGQKALISSFQDSTVFFVNVSNPLSPSLLGSAKVSLLAEDLALTPNGNFAVVSDGGGVTSPIAVINTVTRAVVQTLDLGTRQAQAVAIAPNGTVLIADFPANTVHVLTMNFVTGQLSDPNIAISVGGGPINIAISPDGQTGLVANNVGSSMSVLHITGTGVVALTATLSISRPQSIAFRPDGQRAYALLTGSSVDSIAVLQFNSPGNVTDTGLRIGLLTDSPGGGFYGVDPIAISSNGSKAFVGNPTTAGTVLQNLAVVDLNALTITASLPTGQFPCGVALGGGSLSAPAIAVSPTSLGVSILGEAKDSLYFKIKNTGNATLLFSISDSSITMVPRQTGMRNEDGSIVMPKFRLASQQLSFVSWLTEAPTSGTVTAGDSLLIKVVFNGIGLSPGVYNALINVNSNDPINPIVAVSATLNKSVSNFTTVDNENNAVQGIPDNDMDVYLFNDDPLAPIEFNIFVESTTISSAQLSVLAWDVDWETTPSNPEIDSVVFNGHFVGYLTGATGEWSTSVFSINPAWIVPGPNGKNLVQIYIDTRNIHWWAVTIDWAQLVINGGTSNATFRYVQLDRPTYAPGDTVHISEEIDASPQHTVWVETSLLNPSGQIFAQANRYVHATNGNEPFTEFLVVPTGSPNGTYSARAIAYDSVTNIQENIRIVEFGVQASGTCTPPWTYVNTGINHTIIIPLSSNPNVNGISLQDGDHIGVFYDSSGTLACGGYVRWNGTTNVAVSAYGDDPTTTAKDGFANGEVFKWKIYRCGTNTVVGAAATYAPIGGIITHTNAYATNGISQLTSLVGGIVTQTIPLRAGWSIISSFVTPPNLVLDTIFTSVLSNFIIAKNGAGGVYIPSQGINTIGPWNVTQGYQVKMAASDTLRITGLKIIPELTPIGIPINWSMIGYVRDSEMPIATALSSIVGDIIIVKNQDGQSYIPSVGVNQIGNMKPNHGYQFKMLSARTFTYPANTVLASRMGTGGSEVPYREPTHFLATLRTGSNATIVIPATAVTSCMKDGDELAVLGERGQLAGSAVFSGANFAITVWGDDPTTSLQEGLRSGEAFQFRLFKKSTGKEESVDAVSWKAGDGTYATDGVFLIERIAAASGAEIPSTPLLLQNYPNPFNPTTTIRFGIPEKQHVCLRVYNILGQVVQELMNRELDAGLHNVVFQSQHYPSGVYYYRLETQTQSLVQRMLLVK